MSNSKESVLAKILKYLIYATALVPLVIFSDFISPFHFGKVVVFRSMVYILLIFYIPLILTSQTYRPKLTKVGWAFFFFTVAFSITTITSVLPYPSFWGSLERMGGLFTFWHYFLYFIILTSIFRTEKEWIRLFNFMIFVGVLSAFYGFGQRTDIEFFVGSGGRSRIFGTIGNPALFAGYQILLIFLSIMLFFREGIKRNYKIFYSSAAVIMAIAAFMTAVRGSILAIVVGLLVFCLLYAIVYGNKIAKKVFFVFMGLILIFFAVSLLFKNSSFIKSSGYLTRMADLSIKSYTVQTRFWAWEAGLNGWSESSQKMIFGWGPENFNIPFSKNFNPNFYEGPGSETLFDRAHNMFIEVLVTMGLLGFIAYLWIFAVSFQTLWNKLYSKKTAIYGIGLISLTIAYAIHNSFIFDTSANLLTFFTILGFVSFVAKPKLDAEIKPEGHKSGAYSAVMTITVIALAIASIIAIFEFNVKPAKANYATTRGIVRGWAGDFNGAVEKFKESLSYNVPGKYEYRHRFALYVLEQTNSADISSEQAEIIKYTIHEVQKNVDESLIDYLPYLYIARLYIILGKSNPDSEYNDKSLEYSLKALELSPTFIRTYFEIAQAYLNKKDYENAALYFKKAVELNPRVGLSHWYYGVTLIQKGDKGEGAKIIRDAVDSGRLNPSEKDLERIISVYLNENDYEGLVWIFEKLIKLNPENAQSYASLATAYVKMGRIEDAIKAAKEAARLDVTFEAEARMFVRDLGGVW